MSLNTEDKIPVEITIDDAYNAVIEFLKVNDHVVSDYIKEAKNQDKIIVSTFSSEETPYYQRLKDLVDFITTNELTDELEKKTILLEIIYGNLEGFFHYDDGKYKMAAYAYAGLKGQSTISLSDDEKKQLLQNNQGLYNKISVRNRL